MRALLDTHVALWWLADDDRLLPTHREVIASPANEVLVSSISVAEIAIKASLNKLTAPSGVADAVQASGLDLLAFDAAHAETLWELPWHHRDPFDRMLVAQAMVEQLVLVSVDDRVRAYDVATL